MKNPFRLCLVVIAISVAACSSPSSQLPQTSVTQALSLSDRTSAGQDAVTDTCPKARVYVADYAKSDIEIYPQSVNNPKPCGKITQGISSPEGIYVNAKGTLYVANYSAGTVTEYLRGKRTPSVTLSTTAPGYDVFAGKDGTVYVAEQTLGQVAEYDAGSTTVSRTIAIDEPTGVATDSHNNLYVNHLSNTDGVSHVVKFAPKATSGTDLGFTVSFSGEVKLDKQNDVIVGDRNNNDVIYIYPPGSTTPSRSFSTPGGNPVDFTLNSTETLFYVSGLGHVDVYTFATGVPAASISTGLTSPSGVAAFPPAPY